MTRQRSLLPLLLAIGCRFAQGDTLLLRNGEKIEGRYLSSTEDSVQFAVDGKPFTYSTRLISEIQFHPGASQPTTQAVTYTGPRGKQQQDQFCGVLTDFVHARNQAASEPNPIRRAQMRPADPWSFEDSLARVFGPNGEFVDWTGHLFFSVSGSDVVFTFQPICGPGSSVTFTNGYPVDQRREARAARIPLSSPLAQKLRDAAPGGNYRVSGHLFPRLVETNSSGHTDSRQHFQGAQPSSVANVTNLSTWSSLRRSLRPASKLDGLRSLRQRSELIGYEISASHCGAAITAAR